VKTFSFDARREEEFLVDKRDRDQKNKPKKKKKKKKKMVWEGNFNYVREI
jgi:hypothetical protein